MVGFETMRCAVCNCYFNNRRKDGSLQFFQFQRDKRCSGIWRNLYKQQDNFNIERNLNKELLNPELNTSRLLKICSVPALFLPGIARCSKQIEVAQIRDKVCWKGMFTLFFCKHYIYLLIAHAVVGSDGNDNG